MTPAVAPRRKRPSVENLKVQKRDGRKVDYDRAKITRAVRRCLESISATEGIEEASRAVAGKVETIVASWESPVHVEKIQDMVAKMLMVEVGYEAAEHYILYREMQRRAREEHPTELATAQAFEEDAGYFTADVQRFQHFDKYARWREDLQRRETFRELVEERVMGFYRWHLDQLGLQGAVTADEWKWLELGMLTMQAYPSMRLMQMAGPAAERCRVSVYNCAYAGISDLDYFHEALYILMQGTGFGFSVESERVDDLPRVRRRQNTVPDTWVVEDSTEGWCKSLREGLYRWFDGHDLLFDYSLVRPAGTRLKIKGGTASGPGPLRNLHDIARKIVLSRARRRLRPIDVHDLLCHIGTIVQVGGVRRAAEISLSDLDDLEMRMAKFGNFYDDPRKRCRYMANNSAVYEEKPSPEQFLEEWLSLAKSKSGERGIFNRAGLIKALPDRRRKLLSTAELWSLGCNPCAEILLMGDGQFCNLSGAIVRPHDTVETLLEKVRLAAVYGTIQSSMTQFRYLRPSWAENCERERLLGVDLLGAEDCPLLRAENTDRSQLLDRLRHEVIQTNQTWAARLGIGASTATTCIKPGGNSSLRWGTGQSMSGWLTPYMIRNVEVARSNPLHNFLADVGVPNEPANRDKEGTSIFSWPLKAPEGAQIVADLEIGPGGVPERIKPRRGAIAQLEDWKAFKVHWTEHNPSQTVYVDEHEWMDVGHWVYQNWDCVGGLSFLPLDGGIYQQAPLQPVTSEQFDKFVAAFPRIPWHKLPRYEQSDHTQVATEFACTGDRCVI